MPKVADSQISERPPVIAIMGHIDHGKSALLDYIRKTNIVDREAGGITQHISAYEVEHKDENGKLKKITFLDTPGHEAFQAMRSRGASIADIAVLIVSAEEGIKAQTLEALRAIEGASIPYIIAINKIDKPNADINRTKQSLTENNILIEEWGGKIPCVAISAKIGTGVSELLDMMLLVAEVSELTGDHSIGGEGFILEANTDQRAGTSSTLIIKNGTVSASDWIVTDGEMSKIKRLDDFLGKSAKSLTFSAPARAWGFSVLPAVGSTFKTFSDKKEAETYLTECRSKTNNSASRATTSLPEGTIEIPIVLKTDVAGSLEAVERELGKISNDRTVIRVVMSGVGNVSENDIKLASGSENALVIGFNVKVDSAAKDLAEKYGTPINTSNIIYKLSEWVAEEAKKREPKFTVEESTGRAKILKFFSQTKDRQVIGAEVKDGKIEKNREVKIIRREAEIGRGKIVELQEQKIKVGKVEAGTQFGASIEAKITLAPGDFIEAFDFVTK